MLKPYLIFIHLSFTLFLFCNIVGGKKQVAPDLNFGGLETAFEFPQNVEWFNTDKPLTMANLKGKIVLLFFWKYSSINCIHTLSDLQKLEKKWKEELVIIGIHSPKFPTEQKKESVQQAILRNEITYPVLSDIGFTLWQKYSIGSWPSFVLIDPNGRIFGIHTGEEIYEGFDKIIAGMTTEFKGLGLLNSKQIQFRNIHQNEAIDTQLLFPGKLIVNDKGTEIFISDTNHNRVLRIHTNTRKIIDIIGSGKKGFKDGKFSEAKFHHPQGLTIKEENLYIADSGNHSIRLANLKTKKVDTLAGTGAQAKTWNVPGKGREVSFNSPWDILEYKSRLYITMRGTHQIWTLDLQTLEADVFAGSGSENIFDGKLEEAALAQPTGITKDAFKLFFTDSETSAVRYLDLKSSKLVKTILGKGLFEFGDIDSFYPNARLQFPMGIASENGKLYVADTFNHKIKLIDPDKKESTTIAGTGEIGAANGDLLEASFFEPTGLAVYKNLIYVAETNNHLIRVIDLNTNTVSTFDF